MHVSLWSMKSPSRFGCLRLLASLECVLDAQQGVRFTPGGMRKGASGYDVAFIHPKGNEASPLCGEGVLIELVQPPPEVIEALSK